MKTLKPSFAYRFLQRVPSFLTSEPYEVFFSVALFLSGIVYFVEPRAAGAVGRLLPDWQVYSWGGGLVLGSVATLIGIILASRSKTLKQLRFCRSVESAGQLILAFATSLWSIVIFSVGVAGIASGVLTLFFALVCFIKATVLKGMEEYIALQIPVKETDDA